MRCIWHSTRHRFRPHWSNAGAATSCSKALRPIVISICNVPIWDGATTEEAAAQLRGLTAVHGGRHDVAVVVADGLSALAVHRHAARMLDQIDALASQEGWSLAPVVLVRQGRVAIGDEVGELLDARTVIVLIGERPGLSSPDSLGLYLTYTPASGSPMQRATAFPTFAPRD